MLFFYIYFFENRGKNISTVLDTNKCAFRFVCSSLSFEIIFTAMTFILFRYLAFEIPRLPSLCDDENNDTEWDVLGKMIWFSYAIKLCVFSDSVAEFDARMILSFFVTVFFAIYNDFSTNDFFLSVNTLVTMLSFFLFFHFFSVR